MVSAIDFWLRDRPIETILVHLLLAWALVKVWGFAASFIKTPRDRLDRWILKARLSQAEMKLIKVLQISKELSRLVFECSLCLLYLGLALAFFALGSIFEVVKANGANQVAVLVCTFVGFILVLFSINLAKEISGAVLVPRQTVEKYSAQIDKLKGKLGFRSNPQ